MPEIKRVKPEDFDWKAFKFKEFYIVAHSSESVLKTLQFLSKRGYVWGGSATSLLEDARMRSKLLEWVKDRPVYITIGGGVPNGVLHEAGDTPYIGELVEIDFEEECKMTTFEEVNAKDFDWKLFHNDRVAIMVDKRDMDNLDKVMGLLDKVGYRWGGTHRSLTNKYAPEYESITNASNGAIIYLSTYGCRTAHSLFWYSRLCPSERPVKIVFDERTDNDKIVITNDGKITTATLYSNGKKAGIGTAICHDSDKFDIYTGATLALLRLEKSKKESEMTDWEKFVKGVVSMRVPKKYIRNFLSRAAKDNLKFCGKMEDWYLIWLKQDGDSIVVFVDHRNKDRIIVTDILLVDRRKMVDYIPGMK